MVKIAKYSKSSSYIVKQKGLGRVFSRERLLDSVWGREADIEPRTVDVHIRRLRKAINNDGILPDIIRTVRSAGYALDADGRA